MNMYTYTLLFSKYLAVFILSIIFLACSNSPEANCDQSCLEDQICLDGVCVILPGEEDLDGDSDGNGTTDGDNTYEDGDGDVTSNCDLEICDDECVDTSSNPLHCGSCGNECPYGSCSDSSCIEVCDPLATPFGGGEGSSQVPHLLCAPNHLVELSKNEAYLDRYFRLVSNIDLDGISFKPIGSEETPFSGLFDGAGFEIRNLFIDLPEQDYVGFFGFLSENSLIYNLRFLNADITGRNYTGVLAGASETNLTDISVIGVIMGHEYVGGLTGELTAEGTSKSIEVDVLVTGFNNVGGVAGALSGSISETNAISILNPTIIEDLDNEKFGGIVGECRDGSLDQITSTSTLREIGRSAGGIAGYFLRCSLTSSNFYTNSTTNPAGNGIGGAIGRCRNSEIEKTKGYLQLTSLFPILTVGGIAGFSSQCSLSEIDIEVSIDINSGISGADIGGVLGRGASSTVVNNVISRGNASASIRVGGVSGSTSETTIGDVVSLVSINAQNSAGGLIGYVIFGTTVENSYWHELLSGQSQSAGGGLGLSTSQMANQATFVGFDFDNVWIMDDEKGHPVLRWVQELDND